MPSGTGPIISGDRQVVPRKRRYVPACSHSSHLSLEFLCPGCVRRLFVERLPIAHAAANKFRPGRHGGNRIGFFRQQAPKRRVMPTKLMSASATNSSLVICSRSSSIEVGHEKSCSRCRLLSQRVLAPANLQAEDTFQTLATRDSSGPTGARLMSTHPSAG
jgi:hypothetical protein